MAKTYLDSKYYYWNSGMFLLRADVYLEELKKFAPQVLEYATLSLEHSKQDLDFLRLDEEAFSQCPDISIDYAVMEKTTRAGMIPLEVGWNDVGSWGAISGLSPQDEHHNVMSGDVLSYDTKNSYLRAESRLLATIGLDHHVVIETSDAVLVADKNKVDQVKEIVKQLQQLGRSERLHHTKQYRPWGYHELLVAGKEFQVRRVVIKPGHKIAKQRHDLRTEHWVIVNGSAEITLGEKKFTLEMNQSCYVEKKIVHQISNISNHLLEFIEIQVGSCIKDDDVKRN